MLPLGQTFEQLLFGTKDIFLELVNTFNEFLHENRISTVWGRYKNNAEAKSLGARPL